MSGPDLVYPGGEMQLIRRRTFSTAAILSLCTVFVLLPLLLLGALVVGGTGVGLAAAAGNERTARRAAQLTSVGAGLAVGPVAYFALAVLLAIT